MMPVAITDNFGAGAGNPLAGVNRVGHLHSKIAAVLEEKSPARVAAGPPVLVGNYGRISNVVSMIDPA